jgi:malonyl CoA-acyl carrier protein transacylase
MTVALVFPGQGSQAVGMGRALAESFSSARRVFEEVDAALGEKLSDTIWSGPPETLTLTENAQPALMAVSIAVLHVLEKEAGLDVKRDIAFVAGHSLGEYSALAAARALSVTDAARLLRIRCLRCRAFAWRIFRSRCGSRTVSNRCSAVVAHPWPCHAESRSSRGRRHGGSHRSRP